MEAIAGADKITDDLMRLSAVLEADARRLALEIVDADLTRLENNLPAVMQTRLNEILHHLVLRVNGDRAPSGQLVHVDAVTHPIKTQLDAVMDQPLAAHALSHSRRVQQIHRALFEHTGADALLNILASLRLDYDGLDALNVEQMREQQPGRSRADDADFRVQRGHNSALHDTIVRMKEYPRTQPGTQPEYLYEGYRSSIRRAPSQPLIQVPHTLSELTGPLYGHNPIGESDNDLTRHFADPPLGERIIVAGRVVDQDGRGVPNALVEVWQANASGRYRHSRDSHPAPLDPNFLGAGRAITDAAGNYRFVSIKPGAYPWRNHPNAWRPAHIHFSLFGAGLLSRLVTQMYFPGDPLMAIDTVLHSIADEDARQRLVSSFDLSLTEPEWAMGYRFDIVLRGRSSTPFEENAR